MEALSHVRLSVCLGGDPRKVISCSLALAMAEACSGRPATEHRRTSDGRRASDSGRPAPAGKGTSPRARGLPNPNGSGEAIETSLCCARERARQDGRGDAVAATHEIRSVAVLGTGIMGPGIAQTFGMAGLKIALIGRREEALSRARKRIEASTSEHLANGLLDAGARDRCHSSLSFHTGIEAAADADLVIEAITEDVALKLQVFGDLSDVCRPDTVLASSSGHPMSELDTTVANPSRGIAMHFWNPPDRLPLVEVCPSPRTDPAVTERIESLLYAVGKRPVRIRREIDGFIANRLQFAVWREAINLWATGVASPEDIDAAATASFGRRLAITGPIATAELGGLQTFRDFAAFVFPSLDASDRPPRALEQLLEDDRGLLSWTPEERKALLARRDAELLRQLREDRSAHSSQRRG